MRKTLEALLLTSVAWLAPIQGALATVLGLVILDFLTGILASRKAEMPITSYGIKRTVVKLLVYESSILIAFVVGLYLTIDIPVVHLVNTLIGLTELKSVLENINILAGGNLLTGIIDAIQSKSSNNSQGGSSANLPPDSPRD